MKLVTM